MLILTRNQGEKIHLRHPGLPGGEVVLLVVDVERGRVRLGFVADDAVRIFREEIAPPEGEGLVSQPTRRKPLRKGQTVWLWYGGIVCRATFERRGIFALHKHCRVTIYSNGDVHYAQRRHLHLCREDALNAL